MKPKALFILESNSYQVIYPQHLLDRVHDLVDVQGVYQAEDILEDTSLLSGIEVIFSGWGGPHMDEQLLQAADALKVIFYGAGTIKGIISDAFWASGIRITSSWTANAVPVAEFTLAQVLFSLKHGWHYALATETKQSHRINQKKIKGAYYSTVGLVSLGVIGRMVVEHLSRFDVKVIAFDPFMSQTKADEQGLKVEMVETLEEVFTRSEVVSLHTPWLEETEGLIEGRHIAMMKPNSTFINTSRGAVVKEQEMLETLKERDDVMALLDVVYPEPPAEDSLVWSLPNVIYTPHIAGSLGDECGRMGEYAVDECERWLKGETLQWEITEAKFQTMA